MAIEATLLLLVGLDLILGPGLFIEFDLLKMNVPLSCLNNSDWITTVPLNLLTNFMPILSIMPTSFK
eukprot:1144562-Pelagomonas_calceolata.AAC.2